MRKMMWMACLAMLTMLIVGCDKSSETKKVADKYMELNKKQDLDGMMDMMSFKSDEAREAMKSMIKEKLAENPEKFKKIKNFKFVDETVDEEKGTAVVNYDVFFENDSTAKNQVKLKKVDDKWMVDPGK